MLRLRSKNNNPIGLFWFYIIVLYCNFDFTMNFKGAITQVTR